MMTLYRANKVRFMAVAAPTRVAGHESVPTVAEAGGPKDFEVRASVSLFAPSGTPQPIITRIREEVAKALAEPDVRERFAATGFEPYTISVAEMRKTILSFLLN